MNVEMVSSVRRVGERVRIISALTSVVINSESRRVIEKRTRSLRLYGVYGVPLGRKHRGGQK